MKNVKPYVYRCEHKITKQFYIGYRSANWLPANEDLGIHYFTSSSIISENFNEYSYEILSEYETAELAFKVEQNLIWNSRTNPLLINKNCKSGGFSENFSQSKPTKKERKLNHPPGYIKCPVTNQKWIDPAWLEDVDYLKERIALTNSNANLRKWCIILAKLLGPKNCKREY